MLMLQAIYISYWLLTGTGTGLVALDADHTQGRVFVDQVSGLMKPS